MPQHYTERSAITSVLISGVTKSVSWAPTRFKKLHVLFTLLYIKAESFLAVTAHGRNPYLYMSFALVRNRALPSGINSD